MNEPEGNPLPAEFRAVLRERALAPLWDFLKGVLPHGRPAGVTRPHRWRYADVRPLLLDAGRLVPVEKAERRVLVLSDPGRGADAMSATGTLYAGIQLLLPGETAPTHRHSPSAARIVIEGRGGFTVVNGHRCEMEAGDVILTPGGQWHDHGHDGTEPVTWLDVLDLPVFTAAESAYAEAGIPGCNDEDPLMTLTSDFQRQGFRPAVACRRANPYPMLRYPWRAARAALLRLADVAGQDEGAALEYVNPETGDSCLPMLGFTAMMLAPGQAWQAPLNSASAVFHVIEGNGESQVDDHTFDWMAGDTFSATTFARISHRCAEGGRPAFLIRVDDTPLQRKLGFYQERQPD
ncbi:gentisate 1,2-dioxygenase [Cupriavidus basilensis OR16]|uniref:Gentisate 1,2-dioxygenase n=1 Tax=Cupriavidus basilensis OR16 TaxID=1127483 RepID=H1S8P6_9BURK|nr:cupin domain-containing protein [Cupriavidus basilensis]EHP41088.1 gentisate 1,2-dioxygenase [Cupriavidus basilensis OR16]